MLTVATISALLPVENSDLHGALRGFLKQLLQTGVVEALLVPLETPAGSVTPALVANAALLDRAVPLASVMGLNAARVAGHVSRRSAPAPAEGGVVPARSRPRIGVVLRPCELRALVELAKLQQANRADLLTIGVDCPGTYDVPTYSRLRAAGGPDEAEMLAAARTGELAPQPDYTLRDACLMCERPQVEGADVSIELFGADLTAGIPLSLPEDVAARLDLPRSGDFSRSARDEIVQQLVAARLEARDTRFAEIGELLQREGIEGVLAACVRCHNCMTACPICYCRTCLFNSPTMEHEPSQLLARARRKGAYRLPADTMLFHLTRLNHMALSCVGCGMCTSACPAELPVGSVFRAIGAHLQAVFEYVPGRSMEEPLPLVTFREDEWNELGED